MATVHDEIDNWLAADLYGELSDREQRQLHTHLVDCAACRKTHQETKTMNKILEETLAQTEARSDLRTTNVGRFSKPQSRKNRPVEIAC